MEELRFKIRTPKGPRPKEGLPAFVLEQDRWNDYSFQTLYHLSYYTIGDAGRIEETLIGPVKILKRGQTGNDPLILTTDFIQLGDEFCSVGQSLDYYERLNTLGEMLKSHVLTSLRDVVFTSSLVNDFSNEEGWSVSLFRGQNDAGNSFRILARGLITGDYAQVPNESMKFSFSIPGWVSSVEFNFDAPVQKTIWGRDSNVLPERIAVIVGRNGSGKSTLLARLARVAFGTLDDRSKPPLSDLGVLEPEGVGFPRIITVAFSPFDSFKLPGTDGRNRRQVLKDLERGEGRFSFIGLRDLAAEWTSRGTSANHDSADDEPLLGDRLGRTRLKSIEQLANEFSTYLQKIRAKGRLQLLEDVAVDLFSGTAFEDPEVFSEGDGGVVEDSKQIFLTCSTGHKIALLTVTGLLANIEPYSLVLVDEPETHLHPPLLAALMHALRNILRKHEAFAIVATHSPVVVQESLARHVRVVRREGKKTKIVSVTGETFGESIGLISAEVFGLQSDATDFHKVLDRLVNEYKDIDKIENLFLNDAMSHQARAYVMASLASPKKG